MVKDQLRRKADIEDEIAKVKQRIPAEVVIAWEKARVAEMPALRQPTVDTVRNYVDRVLDFLYTVHENIPANVYRKPSEVSRWLPQVENAMAELDEVEDPGDDYDKMTALRRTLEYLVTLASSAHEKVQWEISQMYGVHRNAWADAADDLAGLKSARVYLSKRDMTRHARTILSQHDVDDAHTMAHDVKKTVNTIPSSVLKAWREAHAALTDVMFLTRATYHVEDIEKVERFGQTTLKFIESAEHMFPDDHIIKDQKDAVLDILSSLEEWKQYFIEKKDVLDALDAIEVRPYIRGIDVALDIVHIHVANRTNTSKMSWYYTDPAYLKRLNITPTQQAEWELVKKRRGPRQLFMEELWEDLYRKERGASRRKSAAQLCAELRRRAGTVIQFNPKLEKEKKELLGIVDEILKTYTDIYDMSSVVFHALQALTTSPDMSDHASSLQTLLKHFQHSIEQLGEAF